ncbi:MAG TPA: RNA methyltransferase [Burkholderiales bacterium]|jgi:tRNA/rRNA methyltransferase|nr:RNA methyltransferase [Burkholderiales bacterium]
MTTPAALDRVRIVLCETSHPGNIGAAARAMKTMGLSRLVLVNPKHFPHADAEAFASGALDVLGKARVCETLEAALAGTVLAVASTSRHRDLTHEVVDCREACKRIVQDALEHEVALVFGPERTGLAVRDVNKCQLIAVIPANREYSSLNLAQAVQVFAYELGMSAGGAVPHTQAFANVATHEELEGFYQHLEDVFHKSGFLDPQEPKRLMQRMRRLFARARLEKEEVNILRGFLRAVRDRMNRTSE